MTRKKFTTQYPGVRYYEHPTRKQRNGQPDRFFSIRYMKESRSVEETLGWATSGWNAEKAHGVLASIRANKRLGQGAQSLADMRHEAASLRLVAQKEQEQAEVSQMLLCDFFANHYMPNAKRTKRSWLTDEQRIAKAINPALGGMPMQNIQKCHIQTFIDGLVDGGAAPTTVKQYKGILHHAFNLASQTMLGGVQIFTGLNPAKGVRIPAIHNNRDRFLSYQEAKELIAKAKELSCPDLHDFIVISLNTGLRLGEIQRLTWSDVDLENAMLTVRDEAMRKPGGKVPLNPTALSVFEARQKVHRLVFPPIFGAHQRENVSHAFKKLVDTTTLNSTLAQNDRARRIVFHSLRHTFASWLALAGTDIYRIKTLMRHKTITMTMRYAHLIPDATREAVHNLIPTNHV